MAQATARRLKTQCECVECNLMRNKVLYMEMKKKDIHKLNKMERFRNWKMVSSFC